ncbi:hypothetical protein K402DRAFT_50001 [Aulographum hederae CBS 113979]|uniref:Periplasmic binding protein-like II n=1 Tax=Aulographum hederae CBS 113979 TaxID=1176131 RepID=A0A6G1H2P5_9PEZI|nr:hypothetical protein K402DRAFT_50001 [Aulographum hederae CBS 113979]
MAAGRSSFSFATALSLTYTSLHPTLPLLLATHLNLFSASNLSVHSVPLPSSKPAADALRSGEIDLLIGPFGSVLRERVFAISASGNSDTSGQDLTILGQLSLAPSFAIASTPDIRRIYDLTNKTILLSSSSSSSVAETALMQKVLSLWGLHLERDYQFQHPTPSPSANGPADTAAKNFAALLNGRTEHGDPVSATLLQWPYTSLLSSPAIPAETRPYVLARAEDYTAPWTDAVMVASSASTTGTSPVYEALRAFLRGLGDAEVLIRDTESETVVLAAIRQALDVDEAIAKTVLGDWKHSQEQRVGTSKAQPVFQMDPLGTLNTLDTMKQFGAFEGAAQGFNYADLVRAGVGRFVDYGVRDSVFGEA